MVKIPTLTRLQRLASGQNPQSVRLGFALFGVGLVLLLVTVVPFFFGDRNRSVWLNLGCMLAPVGFIVLIVGSVRRTRDEQRAALAELYSGTQPEN